MSGATITTAIIRNALLIEGLIFCRGGYNSPAYFDLRRASNNRRAILLSIPFLALLHELPNGLLDFFIVNLSCLVFHEGSA